MSKLDVLDYIHRVHSELCKQHPHKLKEHLNKLEDEDYGGDADEPDYMFLARLCWIARVDKIQEKLWRTVKNNFSKEYKGNICDIITKDDCEKLHC